MTYTAASVLFVDSETRTWNMDTERLHDFLIEQAARGEALPPVIEIVHILGHPAQIEPLLALRERFGVCIIEDAAESLGAYYHGANGSRTPVGAAGDVGCFSLNGNKIITAGGGGVLVTDDVSVAEAARHLTTQARLPGHAYSHDAVGYNYRMTNVHAALGLAQLEQLEVFLQRKREIADRYNEAFVNVPGVELPPLLAGATSSSWLYSILCPSEEVRNRAMDGAEAAGIEPAALVGPSTRTGTLSAGEAAWRGLRYRHRSTRLVAAVLCRFECRGSMPCDRGLSECPSSRMIRGQVGC